MVVSSKRISADLAVAMRIFNFILSMEIVGFASLFSLEQSDGNDGKRVKE